MSSAATPGAGRRVKVSLCMIVKNEEQNLGDCLASCADLVDEMIIVDTGSTDRTKQIAQERGARVFDFPWADSFAVARNESKRHATGDWIFWMDADDRIDAANRDKLRKLFARVGTEKAAYTFRVKVLPSAPGDAIRVVDHGRLFRNLPEFNWRYRVHEQILPAIAAGGGAINATDIEIVHVGYVDAAKRPQKIERNHRLLEMQHRDDPNDPFTLYNLGRIHERQGDQAKALPYWKKSMELADPRETYVRKLYWLCAQAHHKMGQRAQLLQACLAGLARFPDEVDLLFLAGSVLHELGELHAAEATLRRLLATPSTSEYMSLGDDVGIRTFKAHTELGRILHDLKRFDESEAEFREALKSAADFNQALLGLGQVLIEKKRWEEVDEMVARLEAAPNGPPGAAVLRGLKLFTQKDFDQAKSVLEDAISKLPDAVEPRILYSRICWRERKQNPTLVENSLRGVLKIDTGNMEAQRLLNKLKSEQGVPAANRS